MTKDKPLFFTQHQLKRMAKRGMSKAVIQVVVNNGEWRKGKNPFSYEIEYKGIIVILYEQKVQYNVSTCKLNREYTCKAEKLKDKLGIDFWKAVHKIVKELDFSDEIENLV
ncbi:hypothetical protein PQE75_gp008 [Bacillus phage vB_BcoS-136]|uniref:Uncharacterized protein n=1 Tax=Bacillus phage vB_BcoS-136 TaxID=2419619 RepID=A0A3G3BVH6_9CAUD|nr:hypothetical protein PQE75_gp008 [Bacillus phage vB_BcoS-136]AYP68140.1 hypothetical protein vBBcoS136_00008 [Bacillus phage vB_BcoS-136]